MSIGQGDGLGVVETGNEVIPVRKAFALIAPKGRGA